MHKAAEMLIVVSETGEIQIIPAGEERDLIKLRESASRIAGAILRQLGSLEA